MNIDDMVLHEFKTVKGAFAWAAVLVHKQKRCKLYRTDGVWYVELN